MASSVLEGIQQVISPELILLMVIGVTMGIFFGASPGLTTSTGIILALPITYKFNMLQSLSLLLGMYIGGVSGGLITAILLNIPGTPASVPTTLDGYPMTCQGKAARALSIAVISSFIGGFIGFLILFFVAPLLSGIALKFTAAEYFALGFFALVCVAGLSGESLARGVIGVCIGVLMGVVGMSGIDSTQRYTFGNINLIGGFKVISLLVGVYAMKEVLNVAQIKKGKPLNVPEYKNRGFDIDKKEFKAQLPNLFRSSVIGTGIGFLPGMGGSVGSLMAYSVAKNRSKQKELFGKGYIGGLVASEASNNALIGGALIPMLTLGIPGSTTTAVLMTSFVVHGVQPGPLLFKHQEVLMYSLFTILIIGNLMMFAIEYFTLPVFLNLLKVPSKYILTIVVILCTIGAYSANSRMFDVWAILIFSLIGFLFSYFKYPVAPIVIGYVLSPILETNFYRALTLSEGKLIPIIARPISGTVFAISILYLTYTLWENYRKKKKEGNI
ncbi:MAG: tripartite tricarboxylate transporter permease [Clostridiaceae bacterium]|nr:tripartite tricarboxylate transporter permease [Clostridiaceae bacterium]